MEKFSDIPFHVSERMDLLLQRDEEAFVVPTTVHYDSSDPYALIFEMTRGEEPSVEWLVLRSMVQQAADLAPNQTVGVPGADVMFSNDPEGIRMRLDGGSIPADFLIPRDQMQAYLDKSYQVVEPGEESAHCNIDGLIQKLLAE